MPKSSISRVVPSMHVPLLGRRAHEPSPSRGPRSTSPTASPKSPNAQTTYEPLFVHSSRNEVPSLRNEPSFPPQLSHLTCTVDDLQKMCDRLVSHMNACVARQEITMRQLLQQADINLGVKPQIDAATAVKNEESRTYEGPANSEKSGSPAVEHDHYLEQCRAEDLLRQQIEETLARDVEDEERNNSWGEMVATPSFDIVTTVVILLNMIWLGIDTDYNHEKVLYKAPLICQIAANAFCTFFVIEILVRLCALSSWREALNDGWLLFDAIIVLATVWQTWIQGLIYIWMGDGTFYLGGISSFRVLRLARLMKLSRLGALGRIFPEIVVMANAMAQVLRSAGSILVFLCLAIYVYALTFTQMLHSTEAGAANFDTVVEAMNSLLVQVLCGPDADMLSKMLAVGWDVYLVYLSFVFVTSLTLMNTLIAVICAVIDGTSDDAREEQACFEMSTQVERMMSKLDADQSGCLDRDEFDMLLQDKTMLKKFKDLQIDTVAFVDFTHLVFPQSGLSKEDLVRLVLQFRSSKVATVKDLVDMRKYIAVKMAPAHH
eukprot:TRINITY_DN47142_c0_g1_i1.p1 TRINITY_DN47142_c0_g1~~TRINITY_DN47142_c0_g1_i1.p1  ORF type:complete len:547 (+),score=74.82 TRINITY_DN47142_c0_g1_i1:58-1698(+)